jgi:predicted MFS family arabinose efflux permease
MATTTEQNYDSYIKGFKPWYLISFLLAMVWVGIHPVLVPTFVISQTGSATDVLMSLGALAVPLLTGVADKYRAHREVQLICLLLFAVSYFLLAVTQRPLVFALMGLLTGVGIGGASVFGTVFIVGGGYSEEAQSNGLALGSRLWLVGQVIGAALIAGMLAAGLSFQLMFAVAAVILVAAMVLAFFTTKPLAERVLATADQQAAASSQTGGADKEQHNWKEVLFSPFGMTILAILLVYGGWQALNGQYSNYFYGAFGIEPELAASANSLGALLGIVTVGFFAKWLAKSGALPQFNFHALVRVVGALVLLGLGFFLVAGTNLAIWLPLVIYILLMQLRPVQDLAYAKMAARTAPGGAAMAQGILSMAFALGVLLANLGTGFVAENIGWAWVPAVMAILCGFALVLGLRGRKVRDRYLAEVAGEKEAASRSRHFSHQ